MTSSVTTDAPTGGEQVMEYLRILRRRWKLMVAVLVIVTGAALGVSLSSPKRYDATAKLLLTRNEPIDVLVGGGGAGDVDPERDVNTNVQLIKLETVADRVRARLRLRTSSEALLSRIEVEVRSTSDIVRLIAQAPTPIAAARLANAFADEYVRFRLAAARANLREAAALARKQLNSLGDADRETEQGRQLAARLRELEIAAALQTGGVEVVRRATPPAAPSRPRPLLSGALGFIVGALLAVVAALMLDFLDRRIKDEETVEHVFGLPILGVIPRPSRRSGKRDPSEPAEHREAYGLLAANVRYASRGGESHAVMITSPGAAEGKTSVTLGLARALTLLGQRVIAIEADLRRPSFAKMAELPPSQGLSAILSGASTFSDELVWLDASSMRPVTLSGLEDQLAFAVLRAGRSESSPQGLLARPLMAELIIQARALSEVVLIDTAPIGTVNDALALVNLVDTVLIVSRLNKTTKESARSALRVLRNLDVRLPGVVVTDAPPSRLDYEYYAAGERPSVSRAPDSEVGAV